MTKDGTHDGMGRGKAITLTQGTSIALISRTGTTVGTPAIESWMDKTAEGMWAAQQGYGRNSNPYPYGSVERATWDAGWLSVQGW